MVAEFISTPISTSFFYSVQPRAQRKAFIAQAPYAAATELFRKADARFFNHVEHGAVFVLAERVGQYVRNMLYFVVVIFVNRVYQFLREVQRGFERVVLIAKRKAVGRYAFELGQRKSGVSTFARCAVLFERHANIFFSEILRGLERRFARDRVSDVIERFIFREPKRDCPVIILIAARSRELPSSSV